MVSSRTGTRSTYVVMFLLILLACVCISVWSTLLFSQHEKELRVAFLDVGQGDAIFIETSHGHQVLIDGGKGREVLAGLGSLMSFGDRSIDMVIATHPDSDHIGGLPEVFARYAVATFMESGVVGQGAFVEALSESVERERSEVLAGERGMQFTLDDGVVMEVLFPEDGSTHHDTNMGSLVLKVTYGQTSFLLTGDSPSSVESYLVERYGKEVLESSVLKLGHHGSKTSSSEAFLEAVNPEYAVISVGCENSYGHPHQEVLDSIEGLGIPYQSTCTHGTVVFESDGRIVSLK